MPWLALKIEYDGSNYFGWQIQPNAATVQETIESTLSALVGDNIRIIGAGRTDTGVHARGQAASAEISGDFPIPEGKIIPAMNSNLPEDIRITGAKIFREEFHARYDATAREYSYTITKRDSVFGRHTRALIKYDFDYGILNRAADVFKGRHDFTSFSKENPSTKSYICNVETCEWHEIDEFTYRMRIEADRFVYGMVRSLVGAMLDAARGKKSASELEKALIARDRSGISPLAPAKGLILEKIFYPKKLKLFS